MRETDGFLQAQWEYDTLMPEDMRTEFYACANEGCDGECCEGMKE